MKTLYLMVGVPGCGKSWVAQNILKTEDSLYVSRDKIRFSLLRDNESYFAQEKLVFSRFRQMIQDGLNDDAHSSVIADATHLNRNSRMKLLNKLNLKDVAVVPVIVQCSLEKAIERNEQRTGKEKVPESVIRNMFDSFSSPEKDNFNYSGIMNIDNTI